MTDQRPGCARIPAPLRSPAVTNRHRTTNPDAGPIANILIHRAAPTPDRPLLARKHGAAWETITAAQTLSTVRGVAKGLIAAGLKPGAHLAVMSRTRFEWPIIDFAIWTAGLVSVPVYETRSADQVQFILADAAAAAILMESHEHAATVAHVAPAVEHLRQRWTIDASALDETARLGSEITDDELDARTRAVTGPHDATIIYPSGTTGRPKGCVLRHDNLTVTVTAAEAAMPEVIAEPASTLLFIPMVHVYARFISVMSVSAGVLVGHEPDTKDLMRAVATFRPTFLLAVPRVFEKIYNAAEQKATLGRQGRIFRMASDVAVAHSIATAAGGVPFRLRITFALLDRLIDSKLRAALGGRVHSAISGSAPLSPRFRISSAPSACRSWKGMGSPRRQHRPRSTVRVS